MDNFYIITNILKDSDYKITNEVADYIRSKGRVCHLAEKDDKGFILDGTIPENIECGIVLGGDGTLIRAARELRDHNFPLVGINLGTLGYLTEIEIDNYKEAVDKIIEDKCVIEKRIMLKGCVEGLVEDRALNDIVLTRDGELRIVGFNIYVNGELLNCYHSDGIIISSPTGSTGYNLSAGGPILSPTSKAVVITPICPHTLNKSSVVISSEDKIEVEVLKDRRGCTEHVSVTFDGAKRVSLESGHRVCIEASSCTTSFVKVGKESFIERLRIKMKGN